MPLHTLASYRADNYSVVSKSVSSIVKIRHSVSVVLSFEHLQFLEVPVKKVGKFFKTQSIIFRKISSRIEFRGRCHAQNFRISRRSQITLNEAVKKPKKLLNEEGSIVLQKILCK